MDLDKEFGDLNNNPDYDTKEERWDCSVATAGGIYENCRWLCLVVCNAVLSG